MKMYIYSKKIQKTLEITEF